MIRALGDGVGRIWRAPWVALGSGLLAAASGPLLATGTSWTVAATLALLWVFVLGGLVDRLGRDGAVTSLQFLAACRAHVGRLTRLGLAGALLGMGLRTSLGTLAWPVVATLAVLLDYVIVRLVVEDRRSTLAALPAAARFVVRHPGPTLGLHATGVLAAWLVLGPMSDLIPAPAVAATFVLVRLVSLSAALSLFQQRLARPGYMAAPPSGRTPFPPPRATDAPPPRDG